MIGSSPYEKDTCFADFVTVRLGEQVRQQNKFVVALEREFTNKYKQALREALACLYWCDIIDITQWLINV